MHTHDKSKNPLYLQNYKKEKKCFLSLVKKKTSLYSVGSLCIFLFQSFSQPSLFWCCADKRFIMIFQQGLKLTIPKSLFLCLSYISSRVRRTFVSRKVSCFPVNCLKWLNFCSRLAVACLNKSEIFRLSFCAETFFILYSVINLNHRIKICASTNVDHVTGKYFSSKRRSEGYIYYDI